MKVLKMEKTINHERMNDLLKEKLDEAFKELERAYELYEPNSEEIEHESRDGFISSIDGGWKVNSFSDIGYIAGTGRYPSNDIAREHIDSMLEYNYKCAQEAFIEKYKNELEGIELEKINYHDLYNLGKSDLAEILSEMESEYTGEDSIMFEIGAHYYKPDSRNSINDKPTIYLYGVINWEAPYHRAGRDNEIVTTTFDIEFNNLKELGPKLVEALKTIVNELL